MKLDCKPYEAKMKKTLDSYAYTLSTLRAGRATPDVLSPIKFEYYGSPTPITQMAEVKAADARTLVIQPWDATTVKAIEKAILASDLGITPMNDGRVIRLVFPQLTEERRKEMAKQIAKYGEDAKVAIRNVRREANDTTKDLKKKAGCSSAPRSRRCCKAASSSRRSTSRGSTRSSFSVPPAPPAAACSGACLNCSPASARPITAAG